MFSGTPKMSLRGVIPFSFNSCVSCRFSSPLCPIDKSRAGNISQRGALGAALALILQIMSQVWTERVHHRPPAVHSCPTGVSTFFLKDGGMIYCGGQATLSGKEMCLNRRGSYPTICCDWRQGSFGVPIGHYSLQWYVTPLLPLKSSRSPSFPSQRNFSCRNR